jgi:two-component system, chemotaxis family, sensor kinase CheA
VDPSDLETLRQTFVTEAGENLQEIESALLELEARPDDRALLHVVYRVAHTFKGSAGSLGFYALAEIGHSIEDILDDLERKAAPAAPSVCSFLLEGVDAVREMLPDALVGIDRMRPRAEGFLQKLQGQGQDTPRAEAPLSVTGSDRGEVPTGSASLRTVRVDVAKLDRMANLIGEIAVGQGRIGQRLRDPGAPRDAALLEDFEQTERLFAELLDAIRAARMVPIGPWLQQYARAVRDVARDHGKEAQLVVQGGDVEADTAMVERLRDPLTHLIRNAVDHGIERPEIRSERGKPRVGTITLSAWYEGGGIALRITDDGAGLSRAKIAAQARARGSAVDPETIPVEELHRLVFDPGFSTAAAVSNISGRGMGLSVVRQRIEALRGAIRIESVEGAFASFTMRLPLTLATIEGLSVGAGDERFVIPLETVVECLDLPDGELSSDHLSVINLRGRALPCARLRELFAIDGAAPARQSVVVVEHEGGLGGLVVDTLLGEGRMVIKPLDRLFRGIPGIAGSTILGDGRVALILNVATLLGDVAPRQRRTSGREPSLARPSGGC